MNRPYIICHMVTSIDAKVTGEFLNRPACAKAIEYYYDINRNLKSDGFICGRVTMEQSFTGGRYPNLSQFSPVSDKNDFIPEKLSGFYAVAFDTNGKLGWESATIVDPDGDPGYDGAQIVEVLSENVDGRYLGYLRQKGIPYIFAGQDRIDVTQALSKLKSAFHIHRLILEGGSILNGAFAAADVIDELSLVVAPVIAAAEDKPLFYQSAVTDFQLVQTQKKENVLILNYKKST